MNSRGFNPQAEPPRTPLGLLIKGVVGAGLLFPGIHADLLYILTLPVTVLRRGLG